jgi:hypothetical protein
MNTTLQQIHGMLIAQHTALSEALGQTSDSSQAKAILMEMQEVLHRIDLVQNLMFNQTSKDLEQTLPRVTQANTLLTSAIQTIDDVSAFLASSANFLKSVDQAIDIAKTLAV